MRLARSWREWLFVPFLIFGYLETLRRATFNSFGLTTQGTAFPVITVLMVVYAGLNFFCNRPWLRRFYGIFVAFYFFLVITNNYIVNGLDGSASDFPLWSFPLQDGIALTGENKFIFLLIFIFYTILVYLVSHYVLERKSITELTAASALLIGVEIVSSRLDISLMVIAHIVFVLLLRSNAFHLNLLSYDDFRYHKRDFGAGWVGANLIITLAIILLALAIPTKGAGLTLSSYPVKWAKSKIVEKAGLTLTGQPTKITNGYDNFHVYWDKLECFELQGTVQVSDRLVMSVKSSKPFYWRGESADFYHGSGWQNSFEADTVNKSETALPNPYSDKVPVQKVEQTFTMAPDLTSTVVFTGPSPEKVDLPGRVFWSDAADNLFTEEMKSGYTYSVVSYVPEYTEKQLSRAVPAYSSWVERHYLQLPDNLPSRVKEKAEEITKDKVFPYEKAKAIEKFLAGNYPYSMDVTTPAKNRDVVDLFLFDLKKGYCTYHSTAMVVMLRTIGIPARWVKGFATGTYDAGSESYLVKEGDAHAWVEAYFGEYGWVPFEPTASFQMPIVHVQVEEKEEALPKPQRAELQRAELQRNNLIADNLAVQPNAQAEMMQTSYHQRQLRHLIFLVTFCVFIKLWLSIRSCIKRGGGVRVRDYYFDILNLLENRGYNRSECQTPLEFARKVYEAEPGIGKDLLLLTEGYLREQYGKYRVEEENLLRFREAWQNIFSAVDSLKRV